MPTASSLGVDNLLAHRLRRDAPSGPTRDAHRRGVPAAGLLPAGPRVGAGAPATRSPACSERGPRPSSGWPWRATWSASTTCWAAPSVHGMSAHTAVGLVVVLVGAFALRPHTPPAAWYAAPGAGEAAARSLMVPALVCRSPPAGWPRRAPRWASTASASRCRSSWSLVAAMIQAHDLPRRGRRARARGGPRGSSSARAQQNIERFTTLTARGAGRHLRDRPGGQHDLRERALARRSPA